MRSPKPDARDAWRAIFLPGVLASAALLVLYLATVSWRLPLPHDLHGFVLGRDFLNFWAYGREAWTSAAGRFYDIVAYNDFLHSFAGQNYPTQQWSYPPHLMLLMAPFALLPYLPAYVLFTVLGVAALWWAAPEYFGKGRAVLAMALAPAGLIAFVSGQNAFLAAAAIAAIFRCLDRRPVIAGVLLGLLTVKPQLGLLFPLMLILTGRWTVFVSAAVTALVLVGATALLWGPDIWTTYLTEAVPLQEYVIADPTEATMGLMPTAYMNARLLGLSAAAAYAIQAIVTAAAAAAVTWTFWRRRDPLLSYALLLAAGLAATPYLMSYDLVAIVWAMLALVASGRLTKAERIPLLAVYLLPFLAIAGGLLGVPGSALVLPAFCGLLLIRMREGARAPAGLAPPLALPKDMNENPSAGMEARVVD